MFEFVRFTILPSLLILFTHQVQAGETEDEKFHHNIEQSQNIPTHLGEINAQKFHELFGINPEQLARNKLLGKGTFGKVYEVTCFQTKTCALKQNADIREFYYLSQNQNTDSVIKVYSAFIYDDETYILMEKGEKIADFFKNLRLFPKAELPEEGLINSTRSFIKLAKRGEKNSDIKPDNVVWSLKRLRVIDPGFDNYNLKYRGAMGNILARIVLELKLQKELTGGNLSLSSYRAIPQNRSLIASPTYIQYWNQMVCEHYHLSDECTVINNFDSLFSLIIINNHVLKELLKKKYSLILDPKNIRNYRPYNNDNSLPNPILCNSHDIDHYFAKRIEIGTHFCQSSFIKTEYKERVCKSIGKEIKEKPIFIFDSDIAGENSRDQKFKDFIFNIYWYVTRDHVIDFLLFDKDLSNIGLVTDFIIKKETASELQTALLELNNIQ